MALEYGHWDIASHPPGGVIILEQELDYLKSNPCAIKWEVTSSITGLESLIMTLTEAHNSLTGRSDRDVREGRVH